MIKANELRVGNLVNRRYYNPHPSTPQYQYGTGTISAIKPPLFANVEISKNSIIKCLLEDMQPIPLTPEILIAAGFEKIGHYAIGAGSYHVYAKGRIDFLIPKKGDPPTLVFFETKVESVHQLQNLYFSLTGTELDINPQSLSGI